MTIDLVFCGKPSIGAKIIARGLTVPRRIGSKIPPRNRPNVVLNWGSSRYPSWYQDTQVFLNRPESVAIAISKVKTHEHLKAAGIPTIEITIERQQVERWLLDGRYVLARRDSLSSGKGIRILKRQSEIGEFGDFDFYSLYYPKTHEYRVHVCLWGAEALHRQDGMPLPGGEDATKRFHTKPNAGAEMQVRRNPLLFQGTGPEHGELPENGKSLFERNVIGINQKKRVRRDGQRLDRNLYQRIVRSHDNGWIFAQDNLHMPDGLSGRLGDVAVRSVAALGLEFGAVDVAVRCNPDSSFGDLKILEVNTAPGLENSRTIDAYLEAFKKYE